MLLSWRWLRFWGRSRQQTDAHKVKRHICGMALCVRRNVRLGRKSRPPPTEFARVLSNVTMMEQGRREQQKNLPTLLPQAPPSIVGSILSWPSFVVRCPLPLFLRLRSLSLKTLLRGRSTSPILGSWGANDCQRMELHPMSEHERIIRLKTVLARTGLSRSTMYRKIAEGTFPCQIKISVHGAGWRESAVNRWIADPVAFRSESAVP